METKIRDFMEVTGIVPFFFAPLFMVSVFRERKVKELTAFQRYIVNRFRRGWLHFFLGSQVSFLSNLLGREERIKKKKERQSKEDRS